MATTTSSSSSSSITFKITKKHHRRLNNPFPSTPKSLPFVQGNLLFNSQALPSHQIFSIGSDFELLWSSNNGGYLSVSHRSQPTKSLLSTVPGQAFVAAASGETEVEESRGSFSIKDRNIHLVCGHQTVEEISVVNQLDRPHLEGYNHDFSSGYDKKTDVEDSQFPALLITGWIFSIEKKKKKKFSNSGMLKDITFETKEVSACARYWILFDQKSSHQVGFEVRIGEPNYEFQSRPPSPIPMGRYRRLKRRLRRFQRRRAGWLWLFTRPRRLVKIASEDEIGELNKASGPGEFNRVCFSYASEANERFYGFGEQFSHMDFKGKRVPIFVQEQGIGRGDQPITFAANLVSHR